MIGTGRVDLVGAGPGLGDLITVRGLNLLKQADVVIYDRLIDHSLLTHCQDNAELIYAGKSPGCPAKTQEEINALLLDYAQKGRWVLRLKGGDPLVFGRGSEEVDACEAAGIPVSVVPGISSALAVAGAAGIPLTERFLSRSVGIITGHTHSGEPRPDYDYAALAKLDTLVVLMGRKALAEIAQALIEAGKNPNTPAACISNGLLPQQKVAQAPLAEIYDAVEAAKIERPVITVIGPTAERASQQIEPEQRQLYGKRVILTQAYTSTNELRTLLLGSGAEVVDVPMIEIDYPAQVPPLDEAVAKTCDFEWIIFTAVHGVRGFWRRLEAANKDARWLSGSKIAVGGPGSARELQQHGLAADLLPEQYGGAGLVSELANKDALDGRRVLLIQGASALPHVAEHLSAAGASATIASVYATRPTALNESMRRILERGSDVTIFSSPAAVENYVQQGLAESPTQIACIGPTTAGVAREHGLDVAIEPERPGSRDLFTTISKMLNRS